jgi:beta-lactamase class A
MEEMMMPLRRPRRRSRHPRARHLAPTSARRRPGVVVPVAVAASLLAASAAVAWGHRPQGVPVVTVEPRVLATTAGPAGRAPNVPRAARTSGDSRASFATIRNGVRCTGPGTAAGRALAVRVQTKVGPAMSAAGRRVALAVEDSATGVRCTVRPVTRYDSASIVKVSIVAALLGARRAAHRSLSRTERAWARAAITRSDNKAASALWNRVGGAAGMRRFFARAGMTRTVPGARGQWGLTQVTAGDQLTLLRHVTGPGLLATADRRYLRDLMASVVHGQRWGVTAGAPSGARVGLKNGWLHRVTLAWRVHSIGWVELRTTTYDVVLLSSGSASLTAGIGRLERVARAVHAALGTGRSWS